MKRLEIFLPGLFIAARLILFLSLPIEGLRGYSDFWYFFNLAGLGWPYIDLWVEYPPVFPFLSRILFELTGGRQHAWEYVMAMFFTLAQAGSLGIFIRIANRIHSKERSAQRAWIYFALTLGLFFGWAYFDPLAVFLLLLGIGLFLKGHELRSGFVIALGVLIKLFPALGIVVAWKLAPPRKALLFSFVVIMIPVLVFSFLFLISPELTTASLKAQFDRTSWETVWALIDGNINTGNLGSQVDHRDPATVTTIANNPARIPSWLTLIPFAMLGGWLFFRNRQQDIRAALAFLGLTVSVFFLWAPGWSPQWVLYLLPLILLVLPYNQALLFAVVWVLVSLLEWPIILSRGLFDLLWLPIFVRTVVLVLTAISFYQNQYETSG